MSFAKAHSWKVQARWKYTAWLTMWSNASIIWMNSATQALSSCSFLLLATSTSLLCAK